MIAFDMTRLGEEESRIGRLQVAMERFELQPAYQRQSDVWGEEKRQLFIDSLINGYDVPKLYFHRLPGGEAKATYAIVDGKQRLEAIRSFLEDAYSLSSDFVDIVDDGSEAAAGLNFSQLTRSHPSLASRLLRRALDIVVIDTDDLEVIEELFSRLNEAVPLNAPEKRNALGGPMPPVIRALVADHVFFTSRLPIENTRYRQYDLVTKFLFLAARGGFAAVKKKALDDFVRDYRWRAEAADISGEVGVLQRRVEQVLSDMAAVFEEQDSLLASVGLVTVYYMAFLFGQSDDGLRDELTRDKLDAFDRLRKHNRLLLRQQQASIAAGQPPAADTIRQDLAIFDRLMQSPNDGQALEYRYRILRAFLENKTFSDTLPTDLQRRIEQ